MASPRDRCELRVGGQRQDTSGTICYQVYVVLQRVAWCCSANGAWCGATKVRGGVRIRVGVGNIGLGSTAQGERFCVSKFRYLRWIAWRFRLW